VHLGAGEESGEREHGGSIADLAGGGLVWGGVSDILPENARDAGFSTAHVSFAPNR
jgi:hypothetical protein